MYWLVIKYFFIYKHKYIIKSSLSVAEGHEMRAKASGEIWYHCVKSEPSRQNMNIYNDKVACEGFINVNILLMNKVFLSLTINEVCVP